MFGVEFLTRCIFQNPMECIVALKNISTSDLDRLGLAWLRLNASSHGFCLVRLEFWLDSAPKIHLSQTTDFNMFKNQTKTEKSKEKNSNNFAKSDIVF